MTETGVIDHDSITGSSKEIMAELPDDSPIYDDLIARWLGLFDDVPVPPAPDFSDVWKAHPPTSYPQEIVAIPPESSNNDFSYFKIDEPTITTENHSAPEWPELPPAE